MGDHSPLCDRCQLTQVRNKGDLCKPCRKIALTAITPGRGHRKPVKIKFKLPKKKKGS